MNIEEKLKNAGDLRNQEPLVFSCQVFLLECMISHSLLCNAFSFMYYGTRNDSAVICHENLNHKETVLPSSV